VKSLKTLLRLYSYAFHGLLAFAAAAVAIVSLASNPSTVNFYLLPWQGRPLIYGLIVLALVGALILLMAVRGKMQRLFVGWSVVLLALVMRCFFFSPFSFTPETGEITSALAAVLAAALAVVGAGVKPEPDAR